MIILRHSRGSGNLYKDSRFRGNDCVVNGVTLIELMIALFLSGMILFLISTLYLGVQKNRRMNDALLGVQDNIRIATHFLSKAIREAGYAIADDKIHAYFGREIKPGTDAFTVRGASTQTASLLQSMVAPNVLCVSDDPHFSVEDQVVIHDIHTSEIFTIKSIEKKETCQQIVTDRNLQKLYPLHAEVSTYLTNSYYIGKTDRINADGSPLYALYIKDLDLHKTELIEGVCHMKVQYSVWNEGQMQDLEATEVMDWSKVKGVALELEFSSVSTFPLKKTAFIYVAIRE